ncbi:unnamed protein product [Ectocarpus sp. 12 AP-2014]
MNGFSIGRLDVGDPPVALRIRYKRHLLDASPQQSTPRQQARQQQQQQQQKQHSSTRVGADSAGNQGTGSAVGVVGGRRDDEISSKARNEW